MRDNSVEHPLHDAVIKDYSTPDTVAMVSDRIVESVDDSSSSSCASKSSDYEEVPRVFIHEVNNIWIFRKYVTRNMPRGVSGPSYRSDSRSRRLWCADRDSARAIVSGDMKLVRPDSYSVNPGCPKILCTQI